MASNPKKSRIMAGWRDKYCVFCRWVIRGQAEDKTIVQCMRENCRQYLPYRHEKFQWDGINNNDTVVWGTCENCDAFINNRCIFCKECGEEYRVGLARKNRVEKAKLLSTNSKQRSEIEELKKMVKEAEEKAASIAKEKQRLEEVVKTQNEAYFKEKLGGVAEDEFDTGMEEDNSVNSQH